MVTSPTSATDAFFDVFDREVESLANAREGLFQQSEAIEQICDAIRDAAQLPIVLSGIGKAGLIARKVAATFTSTGTPATFVHPSEALHGDLGLTSDKTVTLLFSFSGQSVEIVRLAKYLSARRAPVLAVTKSARNPLAQLADISIYTGDVVEACFLGLAPTSSTTVMLAIGDAISLSVAKLKGIRAEDFAHNHPGGSLGMRFRQVGEVMRTGRQLARVHPKVSISKAAHVVTEHQTAAAILIDEANNLIGIFTDGDLRRCVSEEALLSGPVSDVASCPCKFVHDTESLATAIEIMSENKIEELPVVERKGAVVGLLCAKDLL